MKWFCKKLENEDLNRLPSDEHVGLKPVKPSDYKVWLPTAENVHVTENLKMRTRGEYEFGFPQGLVVHWTSGWAMKRGFWSSIFPKITPTVTANRLKKMAREYALRTVKGGVKNGYNFLVMDIFGNVYQSRSLDKHGYHAGKSNWPNLGYSVSSKLAGVEILSPGKLTKRGDKYFTWFNYEIPSERARYINDPKHGPAGWYCTLTREQEDSLTALCYEMESCSPIKKGKPVFNFNYVLGHHEVSPGRKSDPGGSLSIPMPELRERLKARTEFKKQLSGE